MERRTVATLGHTEIDDAPKGKYSYRFKERQAEEYKRLQMLDPREDQGNTSNKILAQRGEINYTFAPEIRLRSE